MVRIVDFHSTDMSSTLIDASILKSGIPEKNIFALMVEWQTRLP